MTIDPKAGRAGFERAGLKPAPTNNPNPPVGAGLKPAHSNDPATGRRSIRFKGYDYSLVGAYFVTACTVRAGLKPARTNAADTSAARTNRARPHLFGEVMNGEMRLNEYGEMVQDVWRGLPSHYPHVALDAFVIMPNHVHGIIVLSNDIVGAVGAGLKPARTNPAMRHGLPEIVRAFKTFSARRINERRHMAGVGVWQRNYYEHIIRNDTSLNRIRQYIADNPLQWECDRENHEGRPNRASPSQDEPWRT